MSQAHYRMCIWGDAFKLHVPTAAVAEVTWSAAGRRPAKWDLCRGCLIDQLDKADDGIVFEPSAITWIFEPYTRQCIIHHWPSELCLSWDHRALIEHLRSTYADGRPSARSDDPT